MRGKHNKLGEGERKVRLGQDSLPNIAISVAETSGNYIRCFTRTLIFADRATANLIQEHLFSVLLSTVAISLAKKFTGTR